MRTYAKAQVPQQPEKLAPFLDEELSRLEATLSAPKFIAPTLGNSWANYGASYAVAGFYMDGLGRVHLKGLIKSGASAATIFTLPPGFRPEQTVIFGVLAQNNAGAYEMMRIDITSAGAVVAMGFIAGGAFGVNIWASLSGISFVAAV